MDMWICLILTIGAVLTNLAASGRAAIIALTIEDCPWVCARGNKYFSTQILLGLCIVGFILASLKLWSSQDMFLNTWDIMPDSYHIRAYAYLTENYGVAILSWKITSYIKIISGCDGNGGK